MDSSFSMDKARIHCQTREPERLTQAYDETFFCYEAGFTKILEATALKKLLSA